MDQFESSKGKSVQVAVDVAEMPDDLGALLDQGIEDYLS